jgi:DNA-binding NarL/FixJ family response regulator
MKELSLSRMSDSILTLLIDENQKDREYYTERLQSSSPHFVVLQATAGHSGLALCKREAIDCVVLEIDLPDMSGFEVLLKLIPRAQHPEIAVIVLTRFANQYLLEAAIKNGAQAAFHKTMTDGENLHKAILKAVATVQKNSTQAIA